LTGLTHVAISIEGADPQRVIEVGLAPVTVLLAGTGFWSGLLAMLSWFTGGTPANIGAAVDRGVALGFFFASPFAVLTFLVALTSPNS
jgi:hypothetical protein